MPVSDPTKLLWSTSQNLQKIYLNSSQTVSVPVSGGPPVIPTDVLTVTHGLGYVPTARVFYEPVSGELWPISPNQYSNADGGPGTTLDVFGRFYLTTTTLIVSLANLGATAVDIPIYYRIYADE